jgi:hypothetical protein
METRQRCVALFAGLAWTALAVAQVPAEHELPSCVTGTPPLRVAPAAERAALDAGDRRRLHEAAQARYPLYQRAGLAPAQVLLLRRGGGWQYVTLWHGGPAGLCFSAVFTAERFDFTSGWIAKYQPRAADPAD